MRRALEKTAGGYAAAWQRPAIISPRHCRNTTGTATRRATPTPLPRNLTNSPAARRLVRSRRRPAGAGQAGHGRGAHDRLSRGDPHDGAGRATECPQAAARVAHLRRQHHPTPGEFCASSFSASAATPATACSLPWSRNSMQPTPSIPAPISGSSTSWPGDPPPAGHLPAEVRKSEFTAAASSEHCSARGASSGADRGPQSLCSPASPGAAGSPSCPVPPAEPWS